MAHEALALYKFLIADDDPDLASLVETKVGALGSCHIVSSGHEAIEALESGDFDAVVTDYIMQGGDGASLAHYCSNRKIPVLVVSSFPENQIRPYLPEGAYFVNKFHAVRGDALADILRAIVPALRP